MALTYDFDIFDVIPSEGEKDPALDRFMTEIGLQAGDQMCKVALFRDHRTADALRDGPASLRDYFLASGFGLNTYQSGAPPGCYPQKDEDARLDIIRRLTENAEISSMPKLSEGAEDGAFSLVDFLTALAQAQPIDMAQEATLQDTTDRQDLPEGAVEDDGFDLDAAFDLIVSPVAAGPYDLRHPHEVQPKVMPPMFDTVSEGPETTSEVFEAPKPRKKFWHGKFFFLSASAAVLLAAGPLTSALSHLD